MAHTDRDIDRWYRHNHGKDPAAGECTRVWSWNRPPQYCETCDRIWSHEFVRYYVSTDCKSEWNRACRREERGRARNALRRALNGHTDWDDLVINYRRPYFD